MKLWCYWKHYFKYQRCMKDIVKIKMEKILEEKRKKKYESVNSWYEYLNLKKKIFG